MALVNRQRLEGERRLTDAIAMAQGAIAAGHHDTPHAGFDSGVHEIIQPDQIALKRDIKRNPLGGSPLPQRGMVHRPGLCSEMLNRVHPLDRLLAIVIDREVALDPGELSKLRVWWLPRHQDEVVPLSQRADDKGTQLATRACN